MRTGQADCCARPDTLARRALGIAPETGGHAGRCDRCRCQLGELIDLVAVLETHVPEIFGVARVPAGRSAVPQAGGGETLRTGRAEFGTVRRLRHTVSAAVLLVGAIIIMAVGVTRVPERPLINARGVTPSRLSVDARWDHDARILQLQVPAGSGAESYRVRVWTEQGILIAEHEGKGPALRIQLPAPYADVTWVWQVERLTSGTVTGISSLRERPVSEDGR